MKILTVTNKTSQKQRLWILKRGENLARQVVSLKALETVKVPLRRFIDQDELDIRDRSPLYQVTDEDRQRLRRHFELKIARRKI